MGFWREAKSLWIGPEHAWENLDRGESNLAMGPKTIAYQARRKWPLVFPDIESFRTLWRTLETYVGVSDKEPAEGTVSPRVQAEVHGKYFASVDDLLDYPQRDLQSITINATGAGKHARIQLNLRKVNTTDLSRFTSVGGYVFVLGSDEFDPSQTMKFTDITDTLIAMTRPATLWERARRVSVVTRFTEAEYYANSRAAKVRWQAWIGAAVISLMGGYFGAVFKQVLGG